MRSRIAAAVAVIAAVGYLGLSLVRARQFGELSGIGLAFEVCIVAVVLVTGWLIWREVGFGRALQRMAAAYGAEIELPADDTGRPESIAAAAEFELARSLAETEPAEWRHWFRVGLAYDANRDRKRARAAMREAARLFRLSSPSRTSD